VGKNTHTFPCFLSLVLSLSLSLSISCYTVCVQVYLSSCIIIIIIIIIIITNNIINQVFAHAIFTTPPRPHPRISFFPSPGATQYSIISPLLFYLTLGFRACVNKNPTQTPPRNFTEAEIEAFNLVFIFDTCLSDLSDLLFI
jgi:hypothetical protein